MVGAVHIHTRTRTHTHTHRERERERERERPFSEVLLGEQESLMNSTFSHRPCFILPCFIYR